MSANVTSTNSIGDTRKMADKLTQTEIFPLLDLPQVVIDTLVSFLPPRSCLVLRAVCKSTHSWVSNQSWDTMNMAKWKKVSLRITGKSPYTFASAVKMNLPISLFHLENKATNQKIYESQGSKEFVRLYKDRPVKLSVDVLSMFQTANEQRFYSRLQGITHLRVDHLRVTLSFSNPPKNHSSDFDSELDFLLNLRLPTPANLISSLKSLIISHCSYSWLIPKVLEDQYLLKFITSFKNLNLLTPPAKLTTFRPPGVPWFFPSRKHTYCPNWMDALGNAITTRDDAAPECKQNLCIDLRGFTRARYIRRSYRRYIRNYAWLLQESHKLNMSLKCVCGSVIEAIYSHWLETGRSTDEIRESLKFLDNVVTLYYVGDALLLGLYEMNKLEEINISHDFRRHQWVYHNPSELSWASLKTLQVTLYLTERGWTHVGREAWESTFRRVFENDKRSSVTSLILKVRTEKCLEDSGLSELDILFDAEIIALKFSNLKSLTVDGWKCYLTLIKLIHSLAHLTYLNLANCIFLDYSFLANIVGLETLVLHLDTLPNVDEWLFTGILCNMPLKELQIIGKKPLKQPTIKAIKALQEGIFGHTIEKFPFNTWKSLYIKEKDKIQLKKGFRCFL